MAEKERVRGRLCARKLADGVERATMNDISRIISALVFVIIWYALTLIGRALFRPYEKLKMVWCPEARNVSFIETVATSAGSHSSPAVKRCLLWPENKTCRQSCIK
jgi:hypothetical protein